jgi:hypothetical protein
MNDQLQNELAKAVEFHNKIRPWLIVTTLLVASPALFMFAYLAIVIATHH